MSMVSLTADGNNLTLRAFHVPKQEMHVNGEDTGTLTVFVSMLGKYVKRVNPTHMLVAFDGGSSAWRKALYPEYKSDRAKRRGDEASPPFVLIKKFLSLANVPHLELPGYEGDDIIAAVVLESEHTRNNVIVSGDKDLLQLVGKHTKQYRFGQKDGFDLWDAVKVKEEFGVTPEQFPLYLSLVGDKSDGIPGLPGIGPKRALKMLKEQNFDLERLIKHQPKHEQTIRTNLALTDLRTVPLTLDAAPEFRPTADGDPKWPDLLEFCDKYKLAGIKDRLLNEELWGSFLTGF